MATNDGSSRDGSGCAECARLRGRMESLLEHLRQELESPISSILGVAGLLQNSGLSGEQAEYLRVIRDAAEGMDLVRRSLGDMAWQDTQSALGGEADFDLRVLVHDLAELFRIHARLRAFVLASQGFRMTALGSGRRHARLVPRLRQR